MRVIQSAIIQFGLLVPTGAIASHDDSKETRKSHLLKRVESLREKDTFGKVWKIVGDYSIQGKLDVPFILCKDKDGSHYFFMFDFKSAILREVIRVPASPGTATYILPKSKAGKPYVDDK